MDKIEFFNKLDKALKANSIDKIDEILRDYEEYFLESYKLGKSDSEIINELGDPVELGFNYSNQNRNVKEEKKIVKYNEKVVLGNTVMYFLAFSLFFIASIVFAILEGISGFIIMQFINIGFLVLGIMEYKKLKKIRSIKNDLENIEKKDV